VFIMSSESQVLANRRNAQQSTGPRTEEGKEVVSQNAVKHGLCARRDVIRGEDQEEFERHREAMLQDLAPVGAMESMLVQRIVSLSWRLLRAQRMQDAAIEVMCANCVSQMYPCSTLSEVAKAAGRQAEDEPGCDDELTLGLAVAQDFSQARALERLLAYEGKIEASLYKAMAELEKLRRMRRPDGAATQNKANPVCSVLARAYPEPAEGPSGRTPDGVTTSGENKANSVCSVPVRAYPGSAEEPSGRTPDGVTTSGENKANSTDEGSGENKANFSVEQVNSASQDPAGDPVPFGT
jgi:hypothetical protein